MPFDNFDTGLLNFFGLLLVGLLVLILLMRKPSQSDAATQAEITELRKTLSAKDGELREAWKNADKYEALAGERKGEIDRLNGDLSKLRLKIDEEVEEQQRLSNTISRLEAEMKAEREASVEKIEILSKLRADMESKFKELTSEALKLQGEQFSKSNIEKLQATLTPLKEHVGHFERELKAVHKPTLFTRAC